MTKRYVSLSQKADKSEIPDISNLATKDEVAEAIYDAAASTGTDGSEYDEKAGGSDSGETLDGSTDTETTSSGDNNRVITKTRNINYEEES